ncbi:dihydrofolate reductase family protein [Leptospira jelokensis]|uniref:Dihydrofolate reductase n=1 Tax=Leptospira jelokensis TaxID=2484931 RepID=A0A4Z0ZZ62_9LEPT|nr:dihydrofolate reductase family protein [Leptospira jelokensis]TGL65370.1 dihydrofolate reductase [Leptospira jelokensis]
MRKLIMWNVVTLDGYFEGEKPWDLSFHGLVWGKELEEFSLTQLRSADMLVFGAKTYQGMADYWTSAKEEEGEVAKYMNEIPKLACSTTLGQANWNHTNITKDAVSEISSLKQKGNRDMFVFGSASLSASLMEANLFDEFRICVAPVFLGKGNRLFKEGIPNQNLKLIETTPLSTGGVILRYSK